MANIAALLKRIESGTLSYEEKLSALSQVEQSLQDMRQKKQEAIQSNVMLIVDALKQMQVKVEQQLEEAKAIVPQKGPKGDKGEKGDRGLDGVPGKDGRNGIDGKDGKDGNDGISVTDAKIDFDGSLVITLSSGREINVGEVLPLDVSDKIKVIANGGGTSQTVVDTLTSLQNQINTLTGIDGVLGDMAQQNANNVAITGGAINGATIGATTPNTGKFTYLTYTSQSSAPSTPANGFTLYANSGNAMTWKGANGYLRTFDGTSNTADRVYTLPDSNGTIALTSNLGTIASQNANNVAITGGTINGTVIGGVTPAAGTFTTLTATGQTNLGGSSTAPSFRATAGDNPPNTMWIEAKGASTADSAIYLGVGGTSTKPLIISNSANPISFRTTTIGGTANEQFRVSHTASAVNYMQVTGGATGSNATISAQGSDSNIGLTFATKGTFGMSFNNGSGGSIVQYTQNGATSATTNFLRFTNFNGTGGTPSISSQGSDTNIDLALTPKGTGVLAFGTYTAGIVAQAGYITIKDSGGTTRRLLVG